MKIYRADHVGSLLRPPEVLEAHSARAEARISADELREVEDRAILAALELQRAVGLEVFSDGEYRRSSWAGDFSDSVEGYVPSEPPVAFHWKMPDGTPAEHGGPVLAALRTMPQQAGQVIGHQLRQKRRLTAHESAFLKQHAAGPCKITM